MSDTIDDNDELENDGRVNYRKTPFPWFGGKSKAAPLGVIVLAHREAVRTYGSANCWTGTTGTLAAMVFELLKAIGEERGA